MIIYKITNKINNKVYVGQDSKNDPTYFGSGIYIKNSIKKYGKENFIKEIIEYCNSKEELNKKEKYWIEKLDCINSGYNISIGGEGGNLGVKVNKKISKAHKGKKLTDEHKRKIGRSGEQNAFYGKKHSEETKKHLSKISIGRKHSEESKRKISHKTKGKNNGFYGKDHSEELKHRFRKNYGNKVVVTDLLGNNKTYDSVRQASEEENISRFFIKKSSKENIFINNKKFIIF